MSQRKPIHLHPRGTTVALSPVTATSPDGSSTAAPSSSTASKTKSSKSSKTTKTGKDPTTSDTSASSTRSLPSTTSPTSSSVASSSSRVITSTSSITSKSTASRSVAAATASAAVSSSHTSGTSPGLVAFAVIACLAFVGAIVYVIIMRRHHKQREWTFQQHQRIFERFDKSKDPDIRPPTSHTTNTPPYPPVPAAIPNEGKAWQAGTSASVITTGPSVIRNLDWDQGPERRPKSIIEALKPKRKPVPPPKEEVKRKTFSQYLPYLLPQNHSAEVIELGKAQRQVYQRAMYKPVGEAG